MCEQKTVSTAYIDEAANQLREGSGKIQHCLSQLDEQQMWWRPHEAQNNTANLMLHLGDNLRQRIISGVGREPDVRNRPREFAERGPIPQRDLPGHQRSSRDWPGDLPRRLHRICCLIEDAALSSDKSNQ